MTGKALEQTNSTTENGDVSGEVKLLVIKRDGVLVPFKAVRIERAVAAAFREVEELPLEVPEDISATIRQITSRVEKEVYRVAERRESISVEEIQDLVELQLMQSGFYKVARAYIRYREEHKVIRAGSPRGLKVRRRDGKEVRFNLIKIVRAVEAAFRATEQISGDLPPQMAEAVNLVTERVIAACLDRDQPVLDIEWIQDEVERQLMKGGWYDVAKTYILYRVNRAQERDDQFHEEGQARPSVVSVEGRELALAEETIKESELHERIQKAAEGLDGVSPLAVLEEVWRQVYEGMPRQELDLAIVMAARAFIERDPAYALLTARLLLENIYQEVGLTTGTVVEGHKQYFIDYINQGVELERLSPDLLSYDLDTLADAIDTGRDYQFAYLGLQTLYDRYLIHSSGRRIETPQAFWMRVAMGLALIEEEKEKRAIEFYNLLSNMDFVSSTPTLFNSGTCHSQMSSCYLTTIEDDLAHIFKCVADDAQLSKWAGGLGNDWTNVRATGSPIKGTNGKSQGVIPFLKVANDVAVAVNQGGKRKGAMCAYLETWHLDIEEFLELRKNTGDERRRTHDMNTANWIPDLFMKRVLEEKHWTLFSPSDVPDLHDLYGEAFELRYEEYEAMAERGEITLFNRVEAVVLWRKMLSMLFETGHPWLTFKDPSNIRSPQDHVGVVHSSNLCTEILLNTSAEETAVCNLGSINLVSHTTEKGIDQEKLQKTIRTAVRMLDNVVDINFYPTPEARNSNLRHRPIGLGLMGFQDALCIQRISYASEEAVTFADTSMEAISYYALLASSELAAERGTYETYKGSKWDRGILPIDSLALLHDVRGEEYAELDNSSTMDWDVVRKAIKKNGLRNSNTMAIAPTATISNIAGVTQSIEPTYKHLFSKSNLSGEFIVHNPYLVDELKRLEIWDDELLDDLKYFDGSITEIDRIPNEVKQIFLTAFEIEPEWLIDCASRRQKWIDMGQSLNLYISAPSGRRLHEMYTMAWKRGLKTTYYLRSTAATQIEKSTTDINRRGLQPRWMKNKSASSDIVVERAAVPAATCNIDGDCESCQ
jgi:ribonucleoside-diphosphate reductase alpha chain